MVTGVVRWLPHSFDFHFPLSAAARQTSMTPPPPLLYSCHRANTFACDEPRASGAISHDIGAIKSLQIALYRRDDGPVLISLYYPRLLSCGYAVTRPNHPRVLACHRAGVRTAKLSVSSLLLLYLSEEEKMRQPASAGGWKERWGSKCTVLRWVEPNLTIALGDIYRHHHIILSVFH